MMHYMLRVAFQDASSYDHSAQTGGPIGALRLPEVLKRDEHDGLLTYIKISKSTRDSGNHITSMLSYADVL